MILPPNSELLIGLLFWAKIRGEMIAKLLHELQIMDLYRQPNFEWLQPNPI